MLIYTSLFPSNATRHKVVWSRGLGNLLKAGVPLVQALRLIARQCGEGTVEQWWWRLVVAVEAGKTITQALNGMPNPWNREELALLAGGERSGHFAEALLKVAQMVEGRDRINRTVRQALTYPTIVGATFMIVVYLFLTMIVPQYADLYKSQPEMAGNMNAVLVVFRAAEWIALLLPWALLFGLTTAMVLMVAWKQGIFKTQITSVLWSIPWIGECCWRLKLARTWLNISMMLEGGFSLSRALRLMIEPDPKDKVSEMLDLMERRLAEGWTVAQAMERMPRTPTELHVLTAVGESSGQLAEMLQNASLLIEADCNSQLTRYTTLLEPLLILLMALVVGGFAAVTLLPMVNLLSQGF